MTPDAPELPTDRAERGDNLLFARLVLQGEGNNHCKQPDVVGRSCYRPHRPFSRTPSRRVSLAGAHGPFGASL